MYVNAMNTTNCLTYVRCTYVNSHGIGRCVYVMRYPNMQSSDLNNDNHMFSCLLCVYHCRLYSFLLCGHIGMPTTSTKYTHTNFLNMNYGN